MLVYVVVCVCAFSRLHDRNSHPFHHSKMVGSLCQVCNIGIIGYIQYLECKAVGASHAHTGSCCKAAENTSVLCDRKMNELQRQRIPVPVLIER